MTAAAPSTDTLRVPDQAVSIDVARQCAGMGKTRILLAETSAAALAKALELLQRAGVDGDRIEVQTRRTGNALHALARAGVRRAEWSVSAPVPSHPAFAALVQALDAAGDLGMQVALRWPVSAANCGQLPELTHCWQSPHPALRALVLEPDLAGDPPALQDVEAAWPAVAGAAGPKLVRSQRWPACLQGAADEVEPASPRQLLADRGQPVAACGPCSLWAAGTCAGMPAALHDRLASTWPGLRERRDDRRGDQRPRTAGAVQFFSDCAEVRGLRLGLRQAWRLRLPRRDAELFRRDAQTDGWVVALSREPVAITVGGHADLRSAPADDAGAEHLAMVGRDAALLQSLLADEHALLDPPALVEPADLAALLDRHRRLGRAYGFPPCCIEAFCDAYVETLADPSVSDNAWLLQRAARRSRQFAPQLGVLNALLGQACESPLRHLPCRFDCPASLALAQALDAPTMQARPALVWRDGSFAWLDGRWDAQAQSVVALRGVEPVGLTDQSDPAWRELVAELRQADGLRRGRGQVALLHGQEWQVRTNRPDDDFPLLLPFVA